MDLINKNEVPHKFSLWEFKGNFEVVDQLFMMGSPFLIITIIAAYLAFVLKIGPEYMKDKKPYNLNKVLIVYNVLQVIFSLYIFSLAASYLWKHGVVYKTCNIHKKENLLQVTSIGYAYTTAKVTELLDTVFFVLRKKQNQVTFLHVYHHTLMVGLIWVGLKYDLNENWIFLPTMNTFVHIVMYAYYCLSAVPGIAQYLWWKKYITRLQLIQFGIIFVQMVVAYKTTECPMHVYTLYFALVNILLFIYLFSSFYIKSYVNSKKKSKQDLEAKVNGAKKSLEMHYSNNEGIKQQKSSFKNQDQFLNNLKTDCGKCEKIH